MDKVLQDLITAIDATDLKIERLQQTIEQRHIRRNTEEQCQKPQHSQN